MSDVRNTTPLPRRRRERASGLRQFLTIWGPAVLLSVLGFVVAWWFIEPAPPGTVRMAAGVEGGAYAAVAAEYAAEFEAMGVELEIVPSAGSVENYELLKRGEVDLALVQAGTAPEDADSLQALVSVFYEPVLVIVRTDRVQPADMRLDALDSLAVNIGPPGSGTRAAALKLLTATGVEVTASELPTADAAAQLRAGELDAMILVISPSAPLVADLLADERLALADLARSKALARRFGVLEALELPAGGVDLVRDLPPAPVRVVAPAAVVAGRDDLHSAVAQLAVLAALNVHADGDALVPAGVFPSSSYADLPPNGTAEYTLRRGPSFLQRTLPFWAASLVDRLWLLLLPLLGLLIPLFRIAPPTYRWRVRRRIYLWYEKLREIDDDLVEATSEEERQPLRQRLAALDDEASSVSVPLSYMDELYNLRLHIRLLEERAGMHKPIAQDANTEPRP
jgi:hypothetical protein